MARSSLAPASSDPIHELYRHARQRRRILRPFGANAALKCRRLRTYSGTRQSVTILQLHNTINPKIADGLMSAKVTPSYLDFDKADYGWKSGIDYRARPELYRVGKGEQGVLICEPYKSEIAPHWRFRTPVIAKRSARAIYKMFIVYLDGKDFVGADMARKFLQMGYTRARRYANYKGGRKYDKSNDYRPLERGTGDSKKAQCAAIFYEYWKRAESETRYAEQKKAWKCSIG
jgi:hypothetical protein